MQRIGAGRSRGQRSWNPPWESRWCCYLRAALRNGEPLGLCDDVDDLRAVEEFLGAVASLTVGTSDVVAVEYDGEAIDWIEQARWTSR